MMKYSYDEAVNFFKSMPHFMPPKDGSSGKNMFSLDAELALLEKLNRPQDKLKYVHIAGTNGKGSTTTYLANILNEASVVTGAFTSPFLYRYNEMFRVNGKDISDTDFAEVFSQVKPSYDELSGEGIFVSEYEFLTVMAFIYFIKMGCELVLLEVSMGGRMDTTNVIPSPLVSVITPISYDHMTILGNTLTEIAAEKAGIIKPGTVVVSANQEDEVVTVLRNACRENAVPLELGTKVEILERSLEGQRFKTDGRTFFTSLLGTYQVDNASLAIKAARILIKQGFSITYDQISEGIGKTKWFGRFTILRENPTVIIDGGHNRQGALALRESLEAYFPGEKITFVLGILADKEVDLILDTLLPLAEKCYTVAVPNARTMPPKELAQRIEAKGVRAEVLGDYTNLKEIIDSEKVTCVAGSLYLLALLDL